MNPFIFNAPSNDQDRRKQAIIAQITGQGQPAPMNAGQGAVQGANSLLGGFQMRQHNRGPFPDMPGGGAPNPMQGLMNFFGRGGGLY